MQIPIVFEWGDTIKRTGASFHAHCSRCAQVVKMFEAVKNFNVSVFFAVSLWDDEESVVQCGECLGLYVGENADRVRRAAQSKSSVMGSMVEMFRPTRSEPKLPSAPPPRRPRIDEAVIDAELAALKRRLGK